MYDNILTDFKKLDSDKSDSERIQRAIDATENGILCIPKGDTNTWTNRVVTFFGQDWFVFSPPSQTIDEMTPLDWNAHYKVKRYE